MNKKILITLFSIFTFIFAISFSSIILATDGNNLANNAGNAVKDLGNGASQAVKDTGDNVGNAVSNVGNDIGAMGNDVRKKVENTGNMITNTNDYEATRTAANVNNQATNNVWTWVILAIIVAIIIALVWYYSAQNNNINRNDQ